MKKNLKTRLLTSGGPISLTFLLSLGVVPPAFAQRASEGAPAATPAQTGAPSTTLPSMDLAKTDQAPPPPAGFWDRSMLFGDMGGLQPWLGDHGVTLSLQETSEYLNNLSGASNAVPPTTG